jgi:DNA-binding NtrC family response regulator
MWALERAGRDDTESWPLRFAAGNDHDLESVVQAGAFLPELQDALDKIHVELQAHVAA